MLGMVPEVGGPPWVEDYGACRAIVGVACERTAPVGSACFWSMIQRTSAFALCRASTAPPTAPNIRWEFVSDGGTTITVA